MSLAPPFDSTVWTRALTLAERIELVRRHGAARDAALCQEALRRLRAAKPFSDDDTLVLWLDTYGWREDEVAAALAATPGQLHAWLAGEVPPWWVELAAAYSTPVRADAPPVPPEDPQPPQAGFVRLFHPLVVREADRLHATAISLARTDPEVPFDPGRAVGLLLAPLVDRLLELCLRTLILELHVARLRGELEGETAQVRFSHFVDRLRRPEVAVALLSEYPVLARLAVETIAAWGVVGAEILGHLAADHRALAATLNGGTPLGTLERLRGGAGDIHRGGRSVHVLGFSSGFETVYKPHSLSADRHFQALLEWLDRCGGALSFRTFTILDRGDHGWAEFVPAAPCASRAQVERFYERQGGLLALLYLLDANDFHFENLIAAGEHPVLIDLESLFAQRNQLLDRSSATGKAAEAVLYSVLRTGMLPRPAGPGNRFEDLDVSGLGGAAGQLGPAIPIPDDVASDGMRLVRRQVPFEGGLNLPVLDGERLRAPDFVDAIRRGFESVYRVLVRHSAALVAPGGPLARFADDEARVILRPTQTYRLLMLDACHPDLLRDGLARDRHLDRLWTGIGSRPDRRFVVVSEREELARGDVPHFHSLPGGRRLYSGTGEHVEEYFESTGLELAAARIEAFGERDLEIQSWMIGTSLAAQDSPLGRSRRAWPSSLDDRAPATPERLIPSAVGVRRRLEELALVGSDGSVSWIGISATDERHFAPMPLGHELYSGISGIALFLGYLGGVGGDPAARDLAEAAWGTLDRILSGRPEVAETAGAFTGLAGVVHVATQLAELWDRPDLLERARGLVALLAERVATDRHHDVISGAAGCIPILLNLHRAAEDPKSLDLAAECGERILAAAKTMSCGIGWVNEKGVERPLSGFSHGAAGYAWALLLLARETGDERFRDAAREALRYERSLFDPRAGNWRDLRSLMGPDGGFSIAWCHGAVGIGLGRIASLDLEEDPDAIGEMRAEVEVALDTTRRSGFSPDHSLCHGALGTIELLAASGRRLGRAEDLQRALLAAAVVCDEVDAGNFHCGVPGGFETPGLMDGLAGIGYGLLRLAAPDKVPSVFLLEPPPGVVERTAVRSPARRLATVV